MTLAVTTTGDVDPSEDTVFEAVGAFGTVTFPRSPERIVEKRLYTGELTSCYVDAVIHHFESVRHREILDRVRTRFQGYPESYLQKRRLRPLFDWWDRYDGDLPFHRFARQYRREHIDGDRPTVDTIAEAWDELNRVSDPFLDGIYHHYRS